MALLETYFVYLDTTDEPIKVKARSSSDAQAQVQETLYQMGEGRLNVGAYGLVKIEKETDAGLLLYRIPYKAGD